MFRLRLYLAAGVLAVGATALPAVELAPGVDYQIYNAAGPNKVYVVQWERSNPEIGLEIGYPQAKRNYSAKETVTQIQARYDSGPTHEILAATNGSLFGAGNDTTGDQLSGSGIVELPDAGTPRPTFAYMDSGECRIATRPGVDENNVVFTDASTVGIDLVNEDTIADGLVVYTPIWGASTSTTTQGVELIVSGVNYPMRPDKQMSGIVTAVRTGAQSTNNAIPAGGAVLSARDSKSATIQTKVTVGDRITWSIGYTQNVLNNAQMALNGAGWILKDGVANTGEWSNYSASFKDVNPRSMLAYNATTVFLAVIDGRQPGVSVGMTFQQMADFASGTLGATDAINFDGGGSATMVVDGTLRNVPSDGSARDVANAIMVVRRGGNRDKVLADSFPSTGRQLAWDENFYFNDVEAFFPPAPSGDGFVINVMNPAGTTETVRVGERIDADSVVSADIYCEYRPEIATDGYERYGIFARDQGDGSFEWTGVGGGDCYAMTYDSDTGRIRAGISIDGVYTDFRESDPFLSTATAWNKFRIECNGATISYYLNNTLFHRQTDATYANGNGGIGYHEYFTTNTNKNGTRADNFLYQSPLPPLSVIESTWTLY